MALLGARASARLRAVPCVLAVAAMTMLTACSSSTADDRVDGPPPVVPTTASPTVVGSAAASSSPSQNGAASGGSAAAAAVSAWASATARAFSDGDDALTSAADTMTESGRAALAPELATYYSGQTFPGPFPVQVESESREGDTTVVQTCLVNDGWALASDGSAQPTSTIPMAFLVVDDDGTTKVDGTRAGTADCDAVEVEGSPW